LGIILGGECGEKEYKIKSKTKRASLDLGVKLASIAFLNQKLIPHSIMRNGSFECHLVEIKIKDNKRH